MVGREHGHIVPWVMPSMPGPTRSPERLLQCMVAREQVDEAESGRVAEHTADSPNGLDYNDFNSARTLASRSANRSMCCAAVS